MTPLQSKCLVVFASDEPPAFAILDECLLAVGLHAVVVGVTTRMDLSIVITNSGPDVIIIDALFDRVEPYYVLDQMPPAAAALLVTLDTRPSPGGLAPGRLNRWPKPTSRAEYLELARELRTVIVGC